MITKTINKTNKITLRLQFIFIKKKYLNTSARKISHKLAISKWNKKGVVNYDGTDFKTNLKADIRV